jgi:predicted dienelactone hydrolase
LGGGSVSMIGVKSMKVFRRLIIAVALLAVLFAVGLGIAWIRSAPVALPEGSESAARIAPGPHPVGIVELEWVDVSRPTAANGDYPGSPERSFQVALWYPEGATGEHPLAVYSHGFVSSRHGGAYLAEHMASHGYVVVSADYPLTHIQAPGGPNARDVVHQPADVSFLIDRVMALEGAERPFEGEIDTERIGVFGLSLGGATTTLVAFHPEWRDPRVAAAISIAGPGDVFGPRFFDHAAVPFLMIAGTADAIVDYELNALPIPDRTTDGGLVSIAGGTHVGFDQVAAGVMRLLGNPDTVACRLGDADPHASPENPFSGLFGTSEQGLLEVEEYPPPCVKTFERTLSAGRQQMLTTLVIRAFFESHFASEPGVRADHEKFLVRILPAELPEVTYVPSHRARAHRRSTGIRTPSELTARSE